MDEKNVNREIRNAIKIGDINKVKQLIGNDTKLINTKTSFGTWLHIAAKKGNLDIVKFLVQEGIDIDARGGTFDSSALNLAAGSGYLDIVKHLVKAGAELDVSLAKRNPLFGAIYGGHKNVVEFLVEKGIDISIRYTGENIKNMNAYEYAIEFGQTEIAEYLIR
ncbi:ankyrin repeat domain-containing protein [Bacillus thuringiensis]|uniref:ankyrin repeat domain-containing protein n=1 Tax=Bacillus cereus group TaxID=86661 RepID=UPI00086B556D|nr:MULTISPECIES: ankyrin repeat domain-containing protein [Bacillus cereus group]MEC3268011.1 ankyrin repeat domain-containing protein [Bacillus thuringiensis]MED2072816.1 ankyrin repeat domain-containing protein [Bacillus thuringiensis]MED2223783.1 ankyrin repeat domain-containing protein [Bacillus thuringiensis]MED2824159.1 ankyrin repeat domain-containing protein [Bacillus thuringiensis]MED3604436.1 ankyrin repeat domain-containing protein [Bacillus thuringiensis]